MFENNLCMWLAAGEDDIWNFRMFLGCVAAVAGFVMYSHVKLQENSNAAQWQPVIKGVPDLVPSQMQQRLLMSGLMTAPSAKNAHK